MISSIEITCNAAHPEMPLTPFVAFRTSPSSVRVMGVPRRIGNWVIDSVFLKVLYPDNSYSTRTCVRNGNVWIGTLDGTDSTGIVENGFVVGANGVDENGEAVTGYILGVGDVRILDADGSFHPDVQSHVMRILDGMPENPNVGDAYFDNSILKIYDGTQWKDVGGGDLTNYIHSGDNWMKEGIRPKKVILYNSTEEAQQTNVQNLILTPGQVELNAGTNTAKNTLTYHAIRIDEQGSDTYMPSIELGASKGQLKIASGMVDLRYNGPEDQRFRIKGHEILTHNDITPDTDNHGYALNARQAQLAQCDGAGNIITNTYATKNELKNNKITIKQGGVEKGSFTLNQGTDKTIELDAGGGGGSSKCLMCVSGISNSSQWVTWTSGSDTFKVTRSDNGQLNLTKNGTQQTGSYGLQSFVAEVDGNVTIDDNGYPSESNVILDNVRQSSYSPLNTTGKKFLNITLDSCLEQNTLITMADGSTKRVGDLWVGDKVLTLNPDTLQLEEDEVSYCDGGILKSHNLTDIWSFSDGTSIKTVKPHQFFNVRTNKMEYIADFQIGDGVRKQDGSTTTLVSHEQRRGLVYHNTLYTRKYNNYFADGILTGNRKSVKWGWYWKKTNA